MARPAVNGSIYDLPATFTWLAYDAKLFGIFPASTVLMLVVIVTGLLFMKYSKAGRAMLAVSEDSGAAQLMGVNVNGTIALTFAIGSALAAIAGVLLCSSYPSLTPYTGSMPGISSIPTPIKGAY